MTKEEITNFTSAVGAWCWKHDFADFCAATGFTGDYAEQKWRDLKSLNSTLGAFDSDTLAKILNS